MAKLGLSDRDGANAASFRGLVDRALARGDRATAMGYASHVGPMAGPSQIKIRLQSEIGGAYANHDNTTGRVTLSKDAAQRLMVFTEMGAAAVAARYRELSDDHLHAAKGGGSGDRAMALAEVRGMIDGYKTMAHEAAHGHGPAVSYERIGAAVEELTTELVAKRATRDALGMSRAESSFLYHTGYTGMVTDAMSRVAYATGTIVSDHLRDEMEHAAVRFKAESGRYFPDAALVKFVDHLDLDRVRSTGRSEPLPPMSAEQRGKMRDDVVEALSKISVAGDQSTLSSGARAR